jgi:outer membrane cobalamin receptor
MFAESDITVTKKIVGRVGVRSEFSSLMNEMNVVPRLSFAYKMSGNSQISLGYGWFYQTPQDDYLKFKQSLDFEKAVHYIANYQYTKGNQTFRIEGYYKKYDNLVKYDAENLYSSESYTNKGNGYSRGIDIFWRDKPNSGILDYWISYSFLDTERNYKNFQKAAVPTFVSKHNVSLIAKYWINSLSMYLSTAYTYASGRTYENPNNPDFLSDKTKDFHDLSASVSYLTKIAGHFTIVYFSVTNLPGFKNIYGYHFANQPNSEGIYESQQIISPAKRFIFLGVFISLK